nr:sortase [Pseudogracilibacillus auburnensis]
MDIVLPSETEWLTMEEDQNKMTLLTCDPYMINSHRMLVTGHRVPYVPEQAEEVRSNDYTLYYLVGSILALLLIIFFIYRRMKKRGEGQ